MDRLNGSSLEDTIVVSERFINWFRIARRPLTINSKNILMYCYILSEKYSKCEDIPIELGTIKEYDKSYTITLYSDDIRELVKTRGIINNGSLEVVKLAKKYSKEEVVRIVNELITATVTTITDDYVEAVSFASYCKYCEDTGTLQVDVNKKFLEYMKEAIEFSKVYGLLQSATSEVLTDSELMLYSWIVMNDKAIEEQLIKGNIEYRGVKFAELCNIVELYGKPKNNKLLIERYLEGINSKLGLRIKAEYLYKGKRLDRIRFYCEEGGVHVGKYFGQRDNTQRCTNTKDIIDAYKKQYQEHYGDPLPYEEDGKLRRALHTYFTKHKLNIESREDRLNFINNVIPILFKRYESLGYVSANFPRFCSNVLTTKIVDSIIDNKPYRSKNKSSIGQVSTEVYEEINKNARPLTEEEMEEWEV